MAIATTYKFDAVKVLLESTTTPGTYVAPCGVTGRSISLSKEVNDANVPDCADDNLVTWTVRDAVAKSMSISGEGVLARESIARWRAAFDTDAATNVRVEIAGTGANGGGYWLGPFQLTSFEISGARGERATVSFELVSDGAVAWTANP